MKNTVISGIVCVFLAVSTVVAYGQEEEKPPSNFNFGTTLEADFFGGYESIGNLSLGIDFLPGLGIGAYNFGINLFGELGGGFQGRYYSEETNLKDSLFERLGDIMYWNAGIFAEFYYYKVLGIGSGIGIRNLKDTYVHLDLFAFIGDSEPWKLGLYYNYFLDDGSFGIGIKAGGLFGGSHLYEESRVEVIAIRPGTENIPERAYFDGGLRSVTIPNTVKTIGANAFAVNRLEGALVLPAGLTTLGAGAFMDNRISGNLTLPAGITDMGDSAFEKNLISSVTIPVAISFIRSRTFRNNRIQSLVIPATVKRIGELAFSDNRISELTIEEGVTTIDNFAFVYNRSLETVHIPESVTSLGRFAFDPKVTITGNEQFRRTPSESYSRVVFVRQYPPYYSGPQYSNILIDGEPVSNDNHYFFPKQSGLTTISFNINGHFANFPVDYRLEPGHDYEFECSMDLDAGADKYYLVSIYILDKTTNRGYYWKYGYLKEMADTVGMLIAVQRLQGDYYSWVNGFIGGSFIVDEGGNWVTTNNHTLVRALFPRR